MMADQCHKQGMRLSDLLKGVVGDGRIPELQVTGLTLDSRAVVAGDLFIACAGTRQHGMNYAGLAAAQGAVALLAEPNGVWTDEALRRTAVELGLPLLVVPGLSEQVSEIAARFYGRPAEAMRMIGVTGTNGKTSVAHFLARALDLPCGLLGTLGYGMPGQLSTATHTTPDPVRVQALLAELLDAGARAVAMEVSSHALHQHRVAAVPFHTAIFTNLSHDHLDYHGDMESYGEVKARLFRRRGLKLAVLNADDPLGLALARELEGRMAVVLCASRSIDLCCNARFVCAEDIRLSDQGLTFRLRSSWGNGEINSRLLGRFNVDNLLLVIGTLLSWGMTFDDVIARVSALATVPGRMQAFGGGTLPLVVVDYAHTPDALEKALQSLRDHQPRRLSCVFGCGGERDAAKRPLMGAAAERLCDSVIVTDDNPRGEDGAQIVQAILAGMAEPGRAQVERNRAQAIRLAVQAAGPGDMVLVAGKGHEDYQQMGELRVPFSDSEQVRAALAEVEA